MAEVLHALLAGLGLSSSFRALVPQAQGLSPSSSDGVKPVAWEDLLPCLNGERLRSRPLHARTSVTPTQHLKHNRAAQSTRTEERNGQIHKSSVRSLHSSLNNSKKKSTKQTNENTRGENSDILSQSGLLDRQNLCPQQQTHGQSSAHGTFTRLDHMWGPRVSVSSKNLKPHRVCSLTTRELN